MEATTAQEERTLPLRMRGGLIHRLRSDEQLLVAFRAGEPRAFEALFRRYEAKLQQYCTHMLGSRHDAEDIVQEMFVAVYDAFLASDREIAVRPYLYRTARNRCINLMRKQRPTAGDEVLELQPCSGGASTADRAVQRATFRELIDDVQALPESQRTALLLREIDHLPYEDIAQTMDTSVSSVKSLLVRARVSLAESSQARGLVCDEVRSDLSMAAEGLKDPGPVVRKHVKQCAECDQFKRKLKSRSRAMAVFFPVGALASIKKLVFAKAAMAAGSTGSAGSAASATGSAATATGAGAGSAGAAAGIGVGGVTAKAVAVVAAAAAVGSGAYGVVDAVDSNSARGGKNTAARSASGEDGVAGSAPTANAAGGLSGLALGAAGGLTPAGWPTSSSQTPESPKRGLGALLGAPFGALDPETGGNPAQGARAGKDRPGGRAAGAGPKRGERKNGTRRHPRGERPGKRPGGAGPRSPNPPRPAGERPPPRGNDAQRGTGAGPGPGGDRPRPDRGHGPKSPSPRPGNHGGSGGGGGSTGGPGHGSPGGPKHPPKPVPSPSPHAPAPSPSPSPKPPAAPPDAAPSVPDKPSAPSPSPPPPPPPDGSIPGPEPPPSH